jgi:hypothetical protein
MRILPSPALLATLALLGCKPDDSAAPDPGTLEACNDSGCLSLDEGVLALHDAEGEQVLLGATGRAMLDDWGDGGRELLLGDLDCSASADGDTLVASCVGAAGEPTLHWTLRAHPDGWFEATLTVENTTSADVSVAKLSPLYLDGRDGGALFLGEHPSTHRIVENGSYAALDFVADLVPGDVEQNEGYATVMPGSFEGHSVSSWNHGVQDLDSGHAWVAGALTFERTTPVMNISYKDSKAIEGDDGRTGFSYLALEGAYLPAPKVVAPGESLDSEIFAFWIGPDALDGLELYARAIAETLDLVPWHKREPGRRVPNGWNSWSGSSSTGGYGTDINEEVILANLDVMATHLRDWGIDWFQIDDGYEPTYGEWTWREDRFPNGPAWLTQQIRDRGLIPGLWMAPFQIYPDAPLVTEHPDWLADPVALGEVILGDSYILDLTHPEVQDYLRELFTTFREEWGFDWLKLDFGYFALFGEDYHQDNTTREEAWRQGVGVIREALGDDAFFMLVGTLGTNFGILDSGRLGLDSMPIWDWDENAMAWDERFEQQGLKPTLRTSARRYFFQDTVWVNHPDLIFFRSNTRDESWPRLTQTESEAWCSWVALSGGIVKIGDRLVDLEPEHINALRKILPAHGAPARPLDLFTTEYPERWHLHYDGGLDGFSESWDLLGLFHWGFNVDQTTNPYSPVDDSEDDRVHALDLEALGIEGERLAYEFWSGAYLGTVSGEASFSIPAHSGWIIALRQPLGHPQFLGWNRQITMGGVLLGEVVWDEGSSTLTLPMTVAAPAEGSPFEYEIAVYVPDGYGRPDLTSSGVSLDGLSFATEGELLRVHFVPYSTGAVAITLAF